MVHIELNLEEKEQKVHAYIQKHYPNLLDTYITCVPSARFMVMERLINALLREGFLDSEEVERQFDLSKQLEFILPQGTLIIPLKNRYSYNRYRLASNPTYKGKQILHPNQLMEVISTLDEEQAQNYTNLKRFEEELADSVANMGLSLWFQEVRFKEWQSTIDESQITSIFELTKEFTQRGFNLAESDFFEQLSVTGHLLHPCTKSKLGLTIEEILQFSADTDGTVTVHFVAIHKEVTYYNSKLNEEDLTTFWFKEYPALLNELQQRSKKVSNFFIVPVHSWQWQHTLPAMYPNELADGSILMLDYTIQTKPTLSVRTVAPVGKPFHIKLPINIQMTSAVRTISPNSIHNGPELTILIRDILEKENYFADKLAIIGEDLGVRFQSNDTLEVHHKDRNKNLAYLIRKSPESLLNAKEHAIVACALFNRSPISKDLLLYEMVEGFQLNHGYSFRTESLKVFFKKYIEVLLSGVIPMMTKYGIGLEAHLQNTIMVFRGCEPVRVLVRDLGGVRVDTRRLERNGLFGQYYPGSVTINEDEVEMQNKVIHTTFQSHIGELTSHLAEKYEVSETELWTLVKETLHQLFNDLKSDISLQNYVERDKAALLGATVETKALTLMRLKDDVTDYAFIKLPNPLA